MGKHSLKISKMDLMTRSSVLLEEINKLGISLVNVLELSLSSLFLDEFLDILLLLVNSLGKFLNLASVFVLVEEVLDILLKLRDVVKISLEVTNSLIKEREVSESLDWGGRGLGDNSSLLGLESLS